MFKGGCFVGGATHRSVSHVQTYIDRVRIELLQLFMVHSNNSIRKLKFINYITFNIHTYVDRYHKILF